MANIVKRYENFQSTVFELQNLESSLKTNVEKLNSLVHINLFRIKNTNISHPKNDRKDITPSTRPRNGPLRLTKSRKTSPSMNLWQSPPTTSRTRSRKSTRRSRRSWPNLLPLLPPKNKRRLKTQPNPRPHPKPNPRKRWKPRVKPASPRRWMFNDDL